MSRAAVIVNPTKYDDREKLNSTVCAAMAQHGWSEPLWLETTAEDPGEGMAAAAVEAEVDLVLAAGGDGTVTACAAGLAGSGIPLGLLPAGTGNLLARNVGLPLDLDQALLVALTGANHPLDMGSANGKPFVVMAGLGIDAKMLAGASEGLKKRVGWAAYGVSLLRQLGDRGTRASLRPDDGRPLSVLASGIVIGNVGSLEAGIPLLPDARPDDGLLNAVVLTARDWTSWLPLAAEVLTRQRHAAHVRRLTFRELRIALKRAQPWELDGEVVGSTRRLAVSVQPGKLLIRLPAPGDR